MSSLPTSAQLAGAIARLLEDEVRGAVPPELTHEVRVAASLARLLERELTFGPSVEARRRAVLAGLAGPGFELTEAALAERIRGAGDDLDEDRTWSALAELAGLELEVAKPGYADWAEG